LSHSAWRNLLAAFPFWLPVALWMGVIFFLSSLPDSITPGRDIVPDKLCHAAEYLILAFLVLFALHRTTRAAFATSFWITISWVAVYGLSDEIHQLSVPTRHYDPIDLLADVCGALVILLLLWGMRKSGKKGAELYSALMGERKS